MIGVLYCKNSTENGNWCHSWDDVDAWLLDHPQYFVNQETRLDADIWDTNQYVSFGENEGSFPTVTSMNKDF